MPHLRYCVTIKYITLNKLTIRDYNEIRKIGAPVITLRHFFFNF